MRTRNSHTHIDTHDFTSTRLPGIQTTEMQGVRQKVWRRRDDGFTVATIQVMLQRLVQALEAGRIPMGIVVIHEESCASRHLKHCALELNIPMTVSFTGLSRGYMLGSLFPWRRKMIPDLVQSGSRNPNIPVVQLLVARLHRLGGAAVGQDMIHKLAPDEYKKKYHRYLLRSYVEDSRKLN
ncbi:hypothetical protein OROGR_025535 [Orobanche gracilis]